MGQGPRSWVTPPSCNLLLLMPQFPYLGSGAASNKTSYTCCRAGVGAASTALLSVRLLPPLSAPDPRGAL